MLRLAILLRSKRTPGYVFWRQSTLIELEHSKRNYLLSERPVPIAEIARRMIRVKSRYLDTSDFHERNLLRGEYKYFSGKLCDVRHARLEDMIAYLESAAFFGFWDTAQVDRVMRELLLKLEEISHVELVHLFTSLPALRKQTSPLYTHTARALVAAVPALSVEECLSVISACEESAPYELVHNLMSAIAPAVTRGELRPAQAVELIDTWGACSSRIQHQFAHLFHDLKQLAVSGVTGLGALDIAVLCAALRLHGALDASTERVAVRCFLAHLPETCARGVALMCSAVRRASPLPQAIEGRVVFLAPDFTPEELRGVLALYLDAYAAVRGGVDGAETSPPLALRRVVNALMDHLLALLDAAAAFLSPAAQLQHVALFHRAAAALGGADALAEAVPSLGRCLSLLSAKAIAAMREYTYGELVALLQLCAALGRRMDDAAVGAAVLELTRREVTATGEEAAAWCEALQHLNGLRDVHRGRIEQCLVPRLRERCGYAA